MDRIKEVSIEIDGMDCADESEIIEKKLKSLSGVIDFEIFLMNQKVRLKYDSAFISVQNIVKAIAETGMKASFDHGKKTGIKQWWKNKRIVFLIICGILSIGGFILTQFGIGEEVAHIFYIAAILIGGYYPMRMGLSATRTLTMNINTLLIIATIGAASMDLWEEAVILVFVYSLGNVLETFAVDKARGAIRALMELAPKEALIRRNGKEVSLPIEEINLGDIVIVKPGEKIPVDGRVIGGSSFIDQASITGESLPIEKKAGDSVYAGTINQRGSLEIEVQKKSNDTTLARIIHSVEEAQSRKSSYQRFGEKFGRYYTPAMFLLGIGVAVIPPLFLGGDWQSYIYRGLVVFVVSCSCGLALSVPVSVVAAIGNAGRNGILIKGGAYIEIAERLKAIAFDKTGTMTIGLPVVTDLKCYNNISEKEILFLAGTLESRSEHPIAEAIVRKAKENDIIPEIPEFFETYTGLGASAKINGKTYFIGSSRLLQEKGILKSYNRDDLQNLENEGKTIVYLSDEKELLAIIGISDRLRADVKNVMKVLKDFGLKVLMMTGDNEKAARVIANQAGVDEYIAGLLPDDKVEAITKLKKKYGRVAMVGDGINDAPAMATSDIGIAMGASGTDIAVETGDIVLMSDDISRIPYVIKLSKRAVKIIRQNIIASLTVVIFLVPTALLGWINLIPGLIINELGALLVIINGLRLIK